MLLQIYIVVLPEADLSIVFARDRSIECIYQLPEADISSEADILGVSA